MSSEDESTPYPAKQLQTLSQKRYDHFYKDFQKWNMVNGAIPVSQDVLLKYFSELAEKGKPTTLWARYSMLKTTLKLKDDIDIAPWIDVTNFIKSKNVGYKPEKPKLFTEEEIEKFINEAPDDEWLDAKVVCIFGVNGVYRSNNLSYVKVEHIKQYEDMFLVSIPKTEGRNSTVTFTITGTFFRIVQKYVNLRPENTNEKRFFVHCIQSNKLYHGTSIGKSKLSGMPRNIAKYLKLPKPEQYTALSFRIPQTNLAANTGGYNSISVPDPEEDTECTLDCETGLLKAPSLSTEIVESCLKESTECNVNDNVTEHICTLSCGQVKCALEENESSVLHAFNILKPSDYDISDITPAQFASDPMCRWICAYTHIRDPVSSINADETFFEITRSIPSNVKIYQQYIRGNSYQYIAAYVVVYSVNCGCHKETLDLFDFDSTMNEM